jgi:hypothetical protein
MMTKASRRAARGDGADKYLDKYLDSDILEAVRITGDWELLASYIVDGCLITPAMREFLADILLGRVKRPNNRPVKARTLLWHRIIADFVLKREAAGMSTEVAVTEARIHFSENGKEMDRRTVQRALKTWRHRLGTPPAK